MGPIQLLDDNLINKIAAGEVVERPASVVKELVENCLDAGATKITVELQEGGRKRILISDNGSGMSIQDASKALLRHATSKIKNVEDLFSLQTMGFRGEALASISSICKFTLMTCAQGSSVGIRLQTDGSGKVDESPWQNLGGTTIICDDMFYNVPVRQKFLKSAQSEYAAVFEFMQAVSLAYPHVDFTLVHNGKEVLRAIAALASTKFEPTESQKEPVLRARFSQVMRGDAGLSMVYVKGECPYATVTGLISSPGVERTSAKDMLLFVNGRWVKDKSIRFAVLRGYHSHLLRGKYPVVALFLNLDPGLVDANVHPAKTEVRLQYANEIHCMVAGAIRDGLRRGEWASHTSTHSDRSSASPNLHGSTYAKSASSTSGDFSSGSSPRSSSASPFASYSMTRTEAKSDIAGARWRDVTPSVFPQPSKSFTVETSMFDDLGESALGSTKGPPNPQQTRPLNSNAIQSIPWTELTYLGVIADCYLLFSHGDRRSGARLLAVDQHAFHERVLYERLSRNTDLLKSSQALLVPEGVTLATRDIESLKSIRRDLEDNGFRFDFLDDTTVEVKAVPVLLAKSDLQMLLESLAAHEDSVLPLADNSGLTHDILSTMACHGAVRAGEKLGEDELKVLIHEARDVDFFHNCPHGRRVFKWWDEAQIARWFDR